MAIFQSEITISAYLDELTKLSAETPPHRSYMKDFLAGVEPMGIITFGYGAKDIKRPAKEQAMRRAVGTTGGFLGGAAAVPSALGGIAGLGTGLLNWRRGGLRGLGRSAWRGIKTPIQDLRRGNLRRVLPQMAAGGALSGASAHYQYGFGRNLSRSLTPTQRKEVLSAGKPEKKK